MSATKAANYSGESAIPEQRASAKVISVDAKQRHLLIAPNRNESESGWRFCAEAAPDIFSAYASSLGAELSGSNEGGKGSFASSIAESAATIERTQTVNLLRESMYRTCERYLSGALTEQQFIIQAARDQKSMVAVLAIEQLTGALRSRATVISGPGTSAALISGEDAAKLIKEQMKNRDDARTKVEAAKLALARGEEAGICEAVPETSTEGSATKSKADPAKCQALTSEAKSADEALAKAETSVADATKLAASLSSGTSSNTTAAAAQTGGVGRAEMDYQAIQSVAEAVMQIATSPLIDESLMYCIGRLTSGRPDDRRFISLDSPSQQQAALDREKLENEKDQLCLDVIKLDNERKDVLLKQQQAAAVPPSSKPQ